MKIAELPESAVRLLSSSVSIATPHDLIKELLDNAIDAKATSIEIGISANTIDKIQVRDNGHGIDVDDLDCLGRKAHTSKLEHFEELTGKGGLTLGFRGEALASANCLSTIVITTRTSNDPVASRVVINANVGGVRHRQPSSALVGTTVEATQLFEHVPVRKQTALKQSHKSLAKIKELVHCYALARPDLKLVFKVLGEGKPRWSHAPTSPPKFREAAIQIVDASVASNYLKLYSSRDGRVLEHQEIQRQSSPVNLTLQALLPRPDCDVRTIKSRGPFVSVDGRPLCPTRGLPKKLMSILKSHLQKAFARSPSVHNPFFYLGLRCPPGSYDPNVSPSKDEVLFDNEGEVLDRFQELCEHVYGLVGNVQPSDMLTSSMAKRAEARLEECNTTTLQTECLQRSHIIGDVIHKPLIESTEPANDISEQCYGVQQAELGTRFTEPLQVQVPQDQSLRQPVCSSSNLDPGGTTLESTKMRTVMVVDLSRKISDATDDNCTVEMVDIQVPPKKTKLASHQGQASTASGLSTHLWAGSIERYFKPRGTNDFEILIDEPQLTDQSSTLAVRTENPEGSSATGKLRQPLQPLSRSVWNRMNHEAEAQQSNFSSPRINESRAFPLSTFSTGEDPSSPFPTRGVRRTEAEEAEPEMTGPIRTPRRSSDTVRQVQESYLTARPLHQAHTLRMPSSSGPPVGQDARLSLPRPRLSGITTVGHTGKREQQPQQRRNSAIRGNRPEQTLPRTNPDCSQMLHLDGNASSQPILGDSIMINNASSPSPSFMVNRAFNRMPLSRDPESSLEDPADPCEPVDRFPETPTQPALLAQVQYSHFVQTLLMKTPPPGKAEGNAGPPERPPAHPTQSDKTDVDKSPNYTAAGTEVATGQNCCDHVRSRNRKRSRTNSKLFRRTTSSRLPLERVPSGEEVQYLVAQIQLKGEDVERLMKQCENAGLELSEDLTRQPINSQGLLEDEKMERALRAVTDSWLETRARDGKGDMDITVSIEEMHASGGQHK